MTRSDVQCLAVPRREQITRVWGADDHRRLLRVNFGDRKLPSCPFYRVETEALKGQDSHSQIKNVSLVGGERRGQWLTALAAFPKVLGSISDTHMATYNHP